MNMAEHREVRVTARQSVGKLFIAPDLSPVKLIDRELERGIPGWTDRDVKIPSTDMVDGGKDRAAADEAERISVGTMLARPATARREVSRKRPTTRRWS
ncbi:hypothetical protein SEA_YECEY3_102 [Mycobacterium phage Yecey3]|uniref:Uncharacterized protein n=1 Tax=Mycobacterium phage Yecey3 TaxID=2656617 RepID=A0A649VAA7_9CAUD|nr:hypothetical protein KIV58_gp007 [Mycobacterium phage Yecey3]QGJ88852.1 hypothetical protein SEA_YECEY3_102 [Mycobacterium phage Yecey3]